MTDSNKWWRGSVLYQIYPRSFYDSDGDGVGDLKGITAKLDYVASLGVAGIWISPFFPSPMADFGYDVSDYRNIDPLFGTLKDFDRLLKEMHKRNLKLIMDLVLNHTSEKHPWFIESRSSRTNPKADWYVWADPKPDGTAPNNWLSVFGGAAWRYDTRRGQYYFHQFLKNQPDLNVRNPEVQEELLNTVKWWMDRGVDGFRLDAFNHCIHDAQLRDNPPLPARSSSRNDRQTHPYYWQRHLYDKTQPEMIPFIKRLRKLCDLYPGRMMVAEIGDDNQNKTSVAYTNSIEMLHTAYNFALLGPDIYGAKKMRTAIEEYFSEPGDIWPTWAFSNHDVTRVATRWAVDGKPDMRQAKMLIALLTSLRGTSFIYEGEELGLTETIIPYDKIKDPFGLYLWPEDTGRDGCRTPMPWDDRKKNAGFSTAKETWLPIPPEHLKKSVARQEKDKKSMLHFTRTFLRWRQETPMLSDGEIRFIDTEEPLLGFIRTHQGRDLLCVFNLAKTPAMMELAADYTPVKGHGLPFRLTGRTLTLPAFGAFFGEIS